MLALKGNRAMRAAYPTLANEWIAAGRAVANGLPMPPLPEVDVSEEVIARREARALKRRRAAYDKEHPNG